MGMKKRRNRVLRTPARFTVSGRRITMTTGGASAHWRMLARGLAILHGGPPDSGAAQPRRPLPRSPAACTAPRCLLVPKIAHLRRVNCVFRPRPPLAPPQNPVRRTSRLAEAPSTPQIAFHE